MTHDSVPLVTAPGIHPKFPTVKSFLKSYETGLADLTEEQVRLSRFAAQGFGFDFKFDATDVNRYYAISHAQTDLTRMANGTRWHAVHAALSGQGDWKQQWERSVALAYWSGILQVAGDEHLSTLPKYESTKTGLWARAIQRLAIPLGECLALGWLDWAIHGARYIHATLELARGFDGDFERHHLRTQYFMARLIGSWQGWPQLDGPPYAFDEPIFNALLAHWRTPDPAQIAPLLLAACDRHTHESRIDTSKQTHDLSSHGHWYDPFEILAVLRLRQLEGLENPELSHRLMQTPLGQLPTPSLPYMDDLLKGVIEQTKKRFPDLSSLALPAEASGANA